MPSGVRGHERPSPRASDRDIEDRVRENNQEQTAAGAVIEAV